MPKLGWYNPCDKTCDVSLTTIICDDVEETGLNFGSGGPKLNLLTMRSLRLPPPKFTCTGSNYCWEYGLWWNCHPVHNEVLKNFIVPPCNYYWPDENINSEYLTLLLNWLTHFRGSPNGYGKHALKSF